MQILARTLPGKTLILDIFTEEAIELVAIGDQDKDQIECFLCAKGFSSKSILEQHLLDMHDADQTKLKNLMKACTKQTGTSLPNLILYLSFIL